MKRMELCQVRFAVISINAIDKLNYNIIFIRPIISIKRIIYTISKAASRSVSVYLSAAGNFYFPDLIPIPMYFCSKVMNFESS